MLHPSPCCLGRTLPGGTRPFTVARSARLARARPCVRCTAAPDGSTPRGRLPSGLTPNKEDIKKAILGYPADGAVALQPAAGGQAGGGATVALPHSNQLAQQRVEPGSWEDWKLYLEGLDETLQDIQTVDSELADAVAEEDYARAAKLKAQMAELEKQDTVGTLLQEMDAALAEERYSEAAVLRDRGGVGLLGWWAGRGEDDSYGHVIKVTPEFGRYVAHAYTAREIADLTGWSREMSVRDLLTMGPQEISRGPEEEIGLPVFELCVRRDPDSGELEQQAVALFSPVDLQSMQAQALGEDIASLVGHADVEESTLTVERDENGEVVSISVELVTDVEEDSRSATIADLLSSDEAVVSIDQLAGLFPNADEPLDLRQYSSDNERDNDDVQQQISDMLQEDVAAAAAGAAAAERQDSDETSSAVERLMARIEQQVQEDDSDGEDGDNDSTGMGLSVEDELRFASLTLQRAPAQIDWHNRDAFTIRASPLPEQAQQQAAAGREDGGGNGAVLAEAKRLPQPEAEGTSLRKGSDPEQANPPEGSDSGAGEPGQRSERQQRFEAEVQQWAQKRGAKKEQIEAILKATMAAAIAQGIGAVPEAQPSGAVGLEGMCSYTRIPTDHFVKTDPFSGMYLGAFGPHGPELLQLARVMRDGEEWVHATKITGDKNVPAGEVSFRAKIGRQHKLSAAESYPLELGVKGRYKGQGRVAQEGFVHPKWVEGELLLLSPSNPMTHGAELGFVYNIDGVKRFLILFSRLDLDMLN